MKKKWPVILIVLVVVMLVAGMLAKNNLNDLVSEKMKDQITNSDSLMVSKMIDSKFNYQKNKMNFEFTLIEFSSDNCVLCKQLAPILEDLTSSEKAKVNVVFMNTLKPESLPWMKYYGISAQPMLIFLDNTGKEFYRHYGLISFEDLLVKFYPNG